MKAARMAQINALFEAILSVEDNERSDLLAKRTEEDPDLRAEVEHLLLLADEDEADSGGEDLVGIGVKAVAGMIADAEPNLQDHVGPYTLIKEIGRGGMSVVFLAERSDGAFEHQVALKFLAGPRMSERAVARFERERQILARLSHPNVARLLDGGVDSEGRPYLVMEHVDGLPIDEHCDRHRLSVSERIRLMIIAAQVIQEAHRNLIVHRDLKPSNLLVDQAGNVKLLDFGIAKLIDPESSEQDLTKTHERAMTPEYASPEIVQGRSITTASDVYQLGLLLYEVVTGRRAHKASSGSLSELVRVVCEIDPPRPSCVVPDGEDLAETAHARSTSPARFRRELKGDFDAVVARALAKEPERRYASPDHLAADLERLLGGHPVTARKGSTLYRARKLVRRHRVATFSAVLAFMMTVTYAVTLTVQARLVTEQRDRAAAEAAKAAEVERFVVGLFEVANPSQSRGKQVTARELVDAGVERVGEELSGEPEVQARMQTTLGVIYESLGLYEEAQQLQRSSLEQRRRILGSDHLDTAQSLHRLGVMLRRNGQFEEAAPLLTEAESIRRRQLDKHDPLLAESITQRGYLNYFWGRYEEAESGFMEALEIREKIGELEAIGEAESGLALVLAARGRLDEAEERHRRVLTIDRELFGDIHPNVPIDLFNLARLMQMRENYEGAQVLLEEAVEIGHALYGDNHPELGISLSLLANNSQILGDLDRADEVFDKAQAIFEASFEPGHDRILTNRGGIARLRLAQGRAVEAEAILRDIILQYSERFGEDHLRVAHLHIPLGQCLVVQERFDEGRRVLQAAMKMADGVDEQLTSRLNNELRRLEEKAAAAGA